MGSIMLFLILIILSILFFAVSIAGVLVCCYHDSDNETFKRSIIRIKTMGSHSKFYKCFCKIIKYSKDVFCEIEEDDNREACIGIINSCYLYDHDYMRDNIERIDIRRFLEEDVRNSCYKRPIFVEVDDENDSVKFASYVLMKLRVFGYESYLDEHNLVLDMNNKKKIVQLEELMKDFVNDVEKFAKNNKDVFECYLKDKSLLSKDQVDVIDKMKERFDTIIYKFILIMNTAKLKNDNIKENKKMSRSLEKTKKILKDI